MMRLKHAWEYTGLPARLTLFWERVSFSKITFIYLVFSILHCFIQVFFQVQAFSINANAIAFLQEIIQRGNASDSGFAVLGPDLRWCTSVPNTLDASSCPVVWNGSKGSNNAAQAAALSYPSSSSPSVSATPLPDFVISSASVPLSSLSPEALLSVSSSVAPTPSPALSSSHAAVSSSSAAVVVVSPSLISLISSATPAPSSASVVSSSLASRSKSTITITVIEAASSSEVVKASSSATPSASKDAQGNGKESDEDDEDVEDHDKTHHKRSTPQIVSATTTVGASQVVISGLNGTNNVTLDQKCLLALNWPVTMVEDTKREDIVFIGFQVWVLAMSLVALLNESIPHIFASLLTHVIATAWAGYQIFNTSQFRSNFNRLTTQGACGVNLLPTYWKDRGNAEIPILALNVAALVVSAFLTWRLVKLFGWQTFKRVGASFIINRVYNFVLVQSIVIQLSFFFIVVSGGLWLDQVYNGAIGMLSSNPTTYKAVILLVLILLIPWLGIGWIAVRREMKLPMHIFLSLSFLYLVGWGAMFSSPSFRWTFVTWNFFAVMATASLALTLATLILGVVCRLNFGKGLARYLHAEDPSEDDYSPTSSTFYYDKDAQDVEKIAFPPLPSDSHPSPIPTFSAAFGKGEEVPLPSQMRMLFGEGTGKGGPRVKGPRFYNVDASPFEDPRRVVGGGGGLGGYDTTQQDNNNNNHNNNYMISIPSEPPRTHYPNSITTTANSTFYSSSNGSSSGGTEKPLIRHGSESSQHSISSFNSTSSKQSGKSGHSKSSSGGSGKGGGGGGGHSQIPKRWIIE